MPVLESSNTTGQCLELEEPELRATLTLLEVSGGEVRLMACPGSPDPLADVQTAAGACLGGWAEVMAVEGTRLWLQPESSWEEVWRLEKVLGVGREPGLALRLKEVEAGLAPACLHPPATAWRRGRGPPVRGRGRGPPGGRQRRDQEGQRAVQVQYYGL